jgi:two-component system sensor histidine kinase KdpD
LLALLSSLAYNFFFIPPRFTFAISSPEDILLFGLYFLVAAVTGSLSAGLRSRERLLQRRDREASLLLAAAERLSELSSIREAAAAAATLVERYTAAPAVVYVVGDETRPEAFLVRGADELEEVDKKAAKSCAEHNEVCGAGTDRFPDSSYRFIPARAGLSAVAVIGYSSGRKRTYFQSSEDELFAALGRSLALFIEKERSDEASRRATLELESERLAKVLFDSVSHELKTPLTTITGSLSALRDEAIASNPAARLELLEGALCSAKHLNEIVEDFLSIGRMESGRLKLKRNLTEARDLAETATFAASASRVGRQIKILLPETPCDFRLDDVLVVRLIKNLLENAYRYSRRNGSVELRLLPRDKGLAITVADEGPGFGDERMRAPFVKFKRAEGDLPGGLGLGLAMCRGIVEAHGGSIVARRLTCGFEIEAFFPNCQGG